MAKQRKQAPQAAEDALALIETSLDDDQAIDVKVVPLAGKADFADYMVVASGRSARHIDAMTDHLIRKLKTFGIGQVRAEGRETKDWILVDGGDVIVHLFRPQIREHYDIEKLWEVDIAELMAE